LEFKIIHCKAHGDYRSVQGNLFGILAWSKCPACVEEFNKKALDTVDQEESKKNQERIEKALSNSGIPKRFKNCTLENYVATAKNQKTALELTRSYIENFKEVQKTGSSMFYCGNYGTGKTHLAIAVLKKLIETKIQAGKYTTTLRMIRDIRSSYRGGNYSEQQLIDKYINYPLLVLDEVGVQFGTEGEKILLFEVINGRYENYKPTILLSNLTIKEMEKYLGERVIDRLKSKTGSLIVMDWESYRNKGIS